MRGVIAGLLLGAMLAAVIACGGSTKAHTWPDPRHNEITALWTQIRDWRREAKMDLDPAPQMMLQLRSKSVVDAKRVCTEGHPVPPTCSDICSLADAICDNAEAICDIANELGKDDDFAQQKCTSAKASCREAKQRCCGCSENPVPTAAEAGATW